MRAASRRYFREVAFPPRLACFGSLLLSPREVDIASATTIRARIESSLNERLAATLLLRERTAPPTVTMGIGELDELTGGLPRGALSEIAGPASSGRTGVMLAALAAATRREEVCALVDASDSFDPESAQAAGVRLERLLWIRCSDERVAVGEVRPRRKALRRLDQVLRVADLLLQSGGFGMVVLDMGDIAAESTRRIPLTSWFRFRRAVEQTDTVLLLIEQEPCAQTCASLVVQLQRRSVLAQDTVGVHGSHNVGWQIVSSQPREIPANNVVSHAALLQGVRLEAEVVRSWARKPMQTAHAAFELAARYSGG